MSGTYRAVPVQDGGRLAFEIYPAGSPEALFSVATAFDEPYGACYLAPGERLLIVYSRRWFLGEADHQLDFYELPSSRRLFCLYNVQPGDLRFSPDGAQLYQRQQYTNPRDSRMMCLSSITGIIESTQPYDEALFEAGLPALRMA